MECEHTGLYKHKLQFENSLPTRFSIVAPIVTGGCISVDSVDLSACHQKVKVGHERHKTMTAVSDELLPSLCSMDSGESRCKASCR